MPISHAVLLALIQALTEFLPISSSAHLALAPWLFGWEADQGLAFDVALHVGTLLAVVVYFARDWLQIVAHGFGLCWGSDEELRRNPRLLWYLAAGSVPVGISGYLLKEHAETTFRNPFLIATMLISVALLMWWADRRAGHGRSLQHIDITDSLIIGGAQALAVLPGTSRSGITITAGLFRHLDRSSAARFSFLLSTPAVAGAGAKAAYDLYKAGGIGPGMAGPMLTGIAVSAVAGIVVIHLLLEFLRRHGLMVFVWYRIALGFLVLALALGQR